jgi:Predicted metal-binding integral membrane protein (DUF2182)
MAWRMSPHSREVMGVGAVPATTHTYRVAARPWRGTSERGRFRRGADKPYPEFEEPDRVTKGMTVPVDAALEAVVRRDRLVVVTALTAVIALSWAYLLAGAGMGMSAFEMTRISQLGIAGGIAGMTMMTPAVWTPGYAVLMLFMWWVMMVAMMLPSAAPMILLFATVNRKQRETRPSPCRNEHIRGRLSRRLGWLQPGRDAPATGVREDRYPFTDARRDQRDLRRRPAARRGRLPSYPD